MDGIHDTPGIWTAYVSPTIRGLCVEKGYGSYSSQLVSGRKTRDTTKGRGYARMSSNKAQAQRDDLLWGSWGSFRSRLLVMTQSSLRLVTSHTISPRYRTAEKTTLGCSVETRTLPRHQLWRPSVIFAPSVIMSRNRLSDVRSDGA